jgi:hypothetical protein
MSLGRPPSLSLSYVDCQRPAYTPDEGVPFQESWHHCKPLPLESRLASSLFYPDLDWKHASYIHCLSPVLEAISQPVINLEYAKVLELDGKIRDFPVPDNLRSWDAVPSHVRSLNMQRGSLCTSTETCEHISLSLYRLGLTFISPLTASPHLLHSGSWSV